MKEEYIRNGLSSEEVALRQKEGKVNEDLDHTSTSTRVIILRNVFTLFNGINLLLAILVIFTKEYRNMLFMMVIVLNTLIGIVQEIRAKRTLDKLRLLSQPHATVIRDGKEEKILSNEIVLDDLLRLKIGDQILSDGILLEGEIACNESLLTGESNHVLKAHNDTIYAGSFVTSGNGKMKVTAVGEGNYVNHILKNAKREKRQPSRLKDALQFIIKSITIIIVPLGAALFLKQYYFSNIPLNDAILQTVASLVGMIPEGLILLTSVALTLGALKLSFENTLVQELYSLETLARCNVLCLDKTGTITTGHMKVIDTIAYSDDDIPNIIANIEHQLSDENVTSDALRQAYPIKEKMELIDYKHFSSKTKKAEITTKDHHYEIGAYGFLDIDKDEAIEKDIASWTKKGYRILALSKDHKVIGFSIIQDEIRKNAKETLAYFASQSVNLKVISGDDPQTVSNILKKVELKGSENFIDCSQVSDDELKELVHTNTVFGRVTPDQKRLMIASLKEKGNTVGMVGDGVNDVMALKEADFSIAMSAGADSAKNIANVVLLDNDFSHMPKIVNEGRRVINNIERTSTLFLSKTVLSILLSILTIFFLKEYPFAPIQLTLISSLCIGFPSFVLSLEPNYTIVKGSFLANVLSKAIPAGCSIVLVSILLELLEGFRILLPDASQTMYVIITAITLIYVIYSISKPLNLIRGGLIVIAISGMVIAYFLIPWLFYLMELDLFHILLSVGFGCLSILLLVILEKMNLSKIFADRIDHLY